MGWPLFDRIRAYFKQANLYRSENLFQDQTDVSRIIFGNQFFNFRQTQSLLQQTNLQINRLERYKDFDQMDEVGEITLALDLYADEASLQDPERKHVFSVRARSTRVKEELEDLFYNVLLMDNKLRPLIRYLCKYGDFGAEIVPAQNRDGVSSIRFMNVYNFTRIETKYGDLIGFFYQDEFSLTPIFLHPWQVMHLRLTNYENIYHPYGRSILDGARKTFKQLRLMEDAAIIYRLTRAPERRIFRIPVGNISPHEVPGYIQQLAAQLKKKRIFDPASGEISERWAPLIQEDDYWLPQRPDGQGPDVSTLPGAENLDQIADIEYFKKKMVSALKIPFARVGLGEGAGEESQRQSISSMQPEFAKAVQWIQKEVAMGLKKIAIVHLAMKGFNTEDIRNFDIIMTCASAIDELYRIETWNSRADVIATLKDTGMFPDDWILEHFTDLTKDDIRQMKEDLRKTGVQQDAEDVGLTGLEGELAGEGGAPIAPPGGAAPAPPAPAPAPGAPAPPAPMEGYDRGVEDELHVLYEEFLNTEAVQASARDEFNTGLDYFLSSNELADLPMKSEKETILLESVISRKIDELAPAVETKLLLENRGDDEIGAALTKVNSLSEEDMSKELSELIDSV